MCTSAALPEEQVIIVSIMFSAPMLLGLGVDPFAAATAALATLRPDSWVLLPMRISFNNMSMDANRKSRNFEHIRTTLIKLPACPRVAKSLQKLVHRSRSNKINIMLSHHLIELFLDISCRFLPHAIKSLYNRFSSSATKPSTGLIRNRICVASTNISGFVTG
jgi:hypothetical protein